MNLFPAIEIRDVSFSYGKTPVLSHVNMSVRAGDFLAIIGPNGGGKSTLMKLIVGLLNPSAFRRKGSDKKDLGRLCPAKYERQSGVPNNGRGNGGDGASPLQVPFGPGETGSGNRQNGVFC